MHRIGEIGPAMLVDPYFRVHDLPNMLEATEVDHILNGERTKPTDLGSLRIGLDSLGDTARNIEIRVADRTLHDRHVVADIGTVLFIGTSSTASAPPPPSLANSKTEPPTSRTRTARSGATPHRSNRSQQMQAIRTAERSNRYSVRIFAQARLCPIQHSTMIPSAGSLHHSPSPPKIVTIPSLSSSPNRTKANANPKLSPARLISARPLGSSISVSRSRSRA